MRASDPDEEGYTKYRNDLKVPSTDGTLGKVQTAAHASFLVYIETFTH